MEASDLAGIEQSWEIARTVDIIFLVLAFIFFILRLLSEYKNGEGGDLAGHLMIVAYVRDLAKSSLIVMLTCAVHQCRIICCSHLA